MKYKNQTRKQNYNGGAKRPRLESLPNVNNVVSNSNSLDEGGADKIIDTFIEFIEKLNDIDDRLLEKFSDASNKKKTNISNKRDKLSMIKLDIASKLFKEFGSKSKTGTSSPSQSANSFNDDLSDLLGGLKIFSI